VTRGILQIPPLGNSAQPRGYGFIAYFMAIAVSTLVINVVSEELIKAISPGFTELSSDLLIGLALSGLVYLDMYAKYYQHER